MQGLDSIQTKLANCGFDKSYFLAHAVNKHHGLIRTHNFKWNTGEAAASADIQQSAFSGNVAQGCDGIQIVLNGSLSRIGDGRQIDLPVPFHQQLRVPGELSGLPGTYRQAHLGSAFQDDFHPFGGADLHFSGCLQTLPVGLLLLLFTTASKSMITINSPPPVSLECKFG